MGTLFVELNRIKNTLRFIESGRRADWSIAELSVLERRSETSETEFAMLNKWEFVEPGTSLLSKSRVRWQLQLELDSACIMVPALPKQSFRDLPNSEATDGCRGLAPCRGPGRVAPVRPQPEGYEKEAAR